jgi:hypothetical protein
VSAERAHRKIEIKNKMRAYIQGDWYALPSSGSANDEITVKYAQFVHDCDAAGIADVATWRAPATDALYTYVEKSRDALRNTCDINTADVVIVYLQREQADESHWDALACIAYAVARGKPCYVLASSKCLIWTSHFMWHPLVFQHYTERTTPKTFINGIVRADV